MYKLKEGIVHFTPQYSVNARGQVRFSRLFVRLVETPGKLTNMNWELDDETAIKIDAGHLDGSKDLPDSYVAALWSETGQSGGKVLRSAPTYIAEGKNIGKKNATNKLMQAISEATSRWNKNARKGGYVTNKADLNIVQSGRIKPMALHSLPPQAPGERFDISGNSYWKEGNDIFIAPKIDGNRMMASAKELWGRSGDAPPNPLAHIKNALVSFFQKNEDVILDGEVYGDALTHQEINGLYMHEKADASMLRYAVFDVVMPDKSADYTKRISFLRDELKENDVIKLVDSHLVKTSVEIERIYKSHLAAGYEGSVLRIPSGLYEASGRKEKRSNYVLKLKPVYDSEFEIVGYHEGRGSDSGAIVWVLKLPNSDVTFTARPRATIAERRKIFDEMAEKFESEYKGKMMRVLYGDTTKDGIPRFPRAVGVRLLPAIN